MSSPHVSGHDEATIRETIAFARPVRGAALGASLLGAAAVGAGIGLLATAAWLISRAGQHPKESALALGIVAVQFFGLSRGLFRYAHRLLGHIAAFRGLADLRVRTYARLVDLAPAGLPVFRSGELMARFVHDVESLQDLLVRVLFPVAIAALAGGVTVAVIWSILPAAGLILLVAIALAATALPWLTGWLGRRGEARQAVERGELTAAVVDLLAGARELEANGAMARQLEHVATIDARLSTIARRSARTAGVGQSGAVLLAGLATVASIVVGVAAVRSGRIDVTFLAVLAIVPLAAFELTTGLPAASQALPRVRASLRRVDEVLTAPSLVAEPADALPLPAQPTGLRVRGLRCRYDEGGPWVLDGVDLDLVPGRRVAIVGRSGAGKSTLADVLLRFIPYMQGSVTLGGVELCRLRGEGVRQRVGLLAQDAHIFNATIEANLRLARRDATPEQLGEALRKVRLMDWISTLPRGLGTEVGEFGNRMSGGQRQRLAAARVLLAQFPVLVLDEPGEHLDLATADAIVADVLAASPEQAILLITHRLAGLDQVDEVLVLDAGRVVERGTHAELLEADGRYAELWQREVIQTG